MPSDSTKQLLANYHDASRRLQTIAGADLAAEDQEELNQLSSASREIVSRCILSDDPRSLVFLLAELGVLLKVLGQPQVAETLDYASDYLSAHYKKFGVY